MTLTANIPGVRELTTEEMKDTNGGLIWLAVPVVLLLTGCATTGTVTENPVNSAGSNPPPEK